MPLPDDLCQQVANAEDTVAATVSEGKQHQEETSLLKLAGQVGSLLQLQTPGFLSNRVQQRQFGFAVIHLAQHLRKLWGGSGSGSGDTTSTAVGDANDDAAGQPGHWRSTLQIAATWRQVTKI